MLILDKFYAQSVLICFCYLYCYDLEAKNLLTNLGLYSMGFIALAFIFCPVFITPLFNPYSIYFNPCYVYFNPYSIYFSSYDSFFITVSVYASFVVF